MRASGRPIISTALAAATATTSAMGSALPMSSDAEMTSLLAIKRGSSPASSILAIQNKAASGSDPRMLLMKAEIVS